MLSLFYAAEEIYVSNKFDIGQQILNSTPRIIILTYLYVHKCSSGINWHRPNCIRSRTSLYSTNNLLFAENSPKSGANQPPLKQSSLHQKHPLANPHNRPATQVTPYCKRSQTN